MKKKISPYIRLILIMAAGGLFGGLLGFGTSFFDLEIQSVFAAISYWIQVNAPIMMWMILIAGTVASILCYRKGEAILKQILQLQDDDNQERLEHQYDVWGTLGITITNALVCLSIILLAFTFTNLSDGGKMTFFHAVIPFILNGFICMVYQIAAIRQMKRKDPVKYGDAMSMDFHKKWLATCDEAERQIVYQSGYKTFSLMKNLLLIALVIALVVHVTWGIGIFAIVMLGSLYLIMTVSYSIYSTKLQKSQLE